MRLGSLGNTLLSILLLTGLFIGALDAQQKTLNILIVAEGQSDIRNEAMGDARQLGELMGHFNTSTTIIGVADYKPGELNGFDYVFYTGFHVGDYPPGQFLDDVFNTTKPVIWLGTGMWSFSRRYATARKFGFSVSGIDSVSQFDEVRVGTTVFPKGDPHLSLIRITNSKLVRVLGKTYSTKLHRESPYAVQSNNLLYFADSPFSYSVANSEYIYFADYLHDIFHVVHEESHQAMIRIEDVSVFDDPNALREIADILSSRDIPFMVGVIPYFVDPGEGMHLSLSDKPELVDALQYMVRNGGTIVMHGVTHQYKGVTASDYEFWDGNTNKPIKGETEEGIARKLETGIQEFMKNGLFPLVWETPHYTASFKLYRTVAKYFSSACEQRLSIEDEDYSQFFPYIIKKDLFGQTIYPENLGYVPLDSNITASHNVVKGMINNARALMYVRDGIATAFFHSFLDLDLLKQLADGIQGLGYTWLDMREQTHWVRTHDRVILTGDQQYTLNLSGQYLLEGYYDKNGNLAKRIISDNRLSGPVTRHVTVEEGGFYRAEPVEFRETEPTFVERVTSKAEHLYESLFSSNEDWKPARILLFWNHFAAGAAYNDQASLASVFRSINIPVDTVFLGQHPVLDSHNLLVIPYVIADSLSDNDVASVDSFVTSGGNLILDGRTDLAEDFGFRFASSRLTIRGVRDRLFPEERIAWQYSELVTKFDADKIDKVFCADENTEAPLVVGIQHGAGKVIFISSRFDPYSQLGYSRYPFLLEYVKRYFQLRPIVRREQLEMYFEPGLRRTYSLENLVHLWVKNGIRIVHVAGWHEYPKYTYDYARLIRLAHANGILVYLWLEPPQVSQKFWTDHPEWREKNYKGQDVPAAWRYAVALTDTGCVQAMLREFSSLLISNDWDGVNLAELYFESGRGLVDSTLFTPGHPSAQKELKRLYHVDLPSVFDPKSPEYWRTNVSVRDTVVQYRAQKLIEVYDVLLTAFRNLAATKPGFQVIVTAMDQIGSPELKEQLGVDMNQILALQRRYGFSLQVEDPQSRWSTDPRRYTAIGREYAKLLADSQNLMLDLNITSFRDRNVVLPFPTLIQTGTESYELIRAASRGAERFSIYSEATVNPQDLAFFPNALASEVKYSHEPNGFTFSSPYSFVLELPQNIVRVDMDGSTIMPYRNNRYFIPTGRHSVTVHPRTMGAFASQDLQTRLLSATGHISSITYGSRNIVLKYESTCRMLASFSNIPTRVTVDGVATTPEVMKGNDCFTIFLPPGDHVADILTGDQFSYGISITSFWSSTAIAIFGAIAVLLIVLMYSSLKILRRSTRFQKNEAP
jgi:uncharacterized protein YdaL